MNVAQRKRCADLIMHYNLTWDDAQQLDDLIGVYLSQPDQQKVFDLWITSLLVNLEKKQEEVIVVPPISEDEWVTIELIPVEFTVVDDNDPAKDIGYCLSDKVYSWSDCNRALEHVFRVNDLESIRSYDLSPDIIEANEKIVQVRVRRSDLPKLLPNPDQITIIKET